jgi:hypothetical protein
MLSKAFDLTELRIIDNKNLKAKAFKKPKWLDSEYFKSHFHVHVDTNQRKTVIVHHIWAKQSIMDIQGEPFSKLPTLSCGPTTGNRMKFS